MPSTCHSPIRGPHPPSVACPIGAMAPCPLPKFWMPDSSALVDLEEDYTRYLLKRLFSVLYSVLYSPGKWGCLLPRIILGFNTRSILLRLVQHPTSQGGRRQHTPPCVNWWATCTGTWASRGRGCAAHPAAPSQTPGRRRCAYGTCTPLLPRARAFRRALVQ